MNGSHGAAGALPNNLTLDVQAYEPARRHEARYPTLTAEWETQVHDLRASITRACPNCTARTLCPRCVRTFGWYLRLAAANVPVKYWPLEIESTLITDPDAVAFARRAIENIEAVIGNGLGVATFGANGCGKTTLCAYILKAALRRGFAGYFLIMESLLALVKAGFDEVHLRETLRRIRNVDILVLDDLGKEYTARTGFVEAQVDELFRHRDSMGLSTLFSTNLTGPACEEKYGPALRSLWSGSVEMLLIRGRDIRPSVNAWRVLK